MNYLEQIEKQIPTTGMAPTKAKAILSQFTDFFDQVAIWEKQVKSLVITDVRQTREMEMARAARLALKEVRVNAGKRKKELKENILIEGRFIDAIYNLIEGVIKPLEDDLQQKEDFVQIQEQKRIAEITKKREEELKPYVQDISIYNLTALTDDQFKDILRDAKSAHKIRVEAEKLIEQEKIRKAKEEAEYKKKLLEENERLRKEEVERTKLLKEKEKENEKLKQENKTVQARIAEVKQKFEQAHPDVAIISRAGIIGDIVLHEEQYEKLKELPKFIMKGCLARDRAQFIEAAKELAKTNLDILAKLKE